MIERSALPGFVGRLREPRRFLQVVAGPRQVGKTTMVAQALARLGLPAHSASADSPGLQPLAWVAAQWEQGRALAVQHGHAVLVLDEIQKIPRWTEEVKRLWDEDSRQRRDLRVVVLGSAPLLIERGLTESLAGRLVHPCPPMPSCTAAATSASCAVPRTPRNWSHARTRWATVRWRSPTSVRSPAWCARMPRPSVLGLHLIVGAEMRCTHPVVKGADAAPARGWCCWRMSRRGYGNLSQWITVARRRAPKGAYLALMSDVEGKVPMRPRWPACPTAWRCWWPPMCCRRNPRPAHWGAATASRRCSPRRCG
jgi:hypothetical protein